MSERRVPAVPHAAVCGLISCDIHTQNCWRDPHSRVGELLVVFHSPPVEDAFKKDLICIYILVVLQE